LNLYKKGCQRLTAFFVSYHHSLSSLVDGPKRKAFNTLFVQTIDSNKYRN